MGLLYQTAFARETVTICHRTGSHSNPYVVHHPSKSGDVSGHDGHEGGVYPADPWGDIIPPFTFDGGSYPGKNWGSVGQAIYNNGCKLAEPTSTPVPPTKTPVNPTDTLEPTETKITPSATVKVTDTPTDRPPTKPPPTSTRVPPTNTPRPSKTPKPTSTEKLATATETNTPTITPKPMVCSVTAVSSGFCEPLVYQLQPVSCGCGGSAPVVVEINNLSDQPGEMQELRLDEIEDKLDAIVTIGVVLVVAVGAMSVSAVYAAFFKK
jgi:hypothetical protein